MEFVTRAEKESIEVRLAALVANRQVIAERIAEARAMGDLKENGDYHAAREQQGIEESEIRRLEQRITRLVVTEEGGHKAAGVVFVGATIKIHEESRADSVETLRMVGEFSGTETDEVTEVTPTSPMGEALMKARVGEVVTVRTPRGVKRFKIIEIL